MSHERVTVYHRGNPHKDIKEMSSASKYESVSLPDKDVENDLSLHIHLGIMELSTGRLNEEDKSVLMDLIQMRKIAQMGGFETNLRFYGIKGLNQALEAYRETRDKKLKESDRLLQMRSTRREFIGFVSTAFVATAATVLLGTDRYRERSSAFTQLSSAKGELTSLGNKLDQVVDPEDRERVLIEAKPFASQYVNASEKIYDLDEWVSFGTTLKALGLLVSGTLAAGSIAVAIGIARENKNKPQIQPSSEHS